MADFPLTPDFVYVEEIKFNTLISKFENGYEQRRAKWSSDLRKFRLEFKNRSKDDFEDLRDFFITKKGAYSSFTFENPNDSVEYNVRFADDNLSLQEKAYQIYDFACDLVEVRA